MSSLSTIEEVRVHHTAPLCSATIANGLRKFAGYREPVFVCIGSDRSTGDSLGPIVGTLLKRANIPNVYGTLDAPVHATNLAEVLDSIKRDHPGAFVIAVDACLGSAEATGDLIVRNYPLKPGAGVRKDLPSAGDISIAGIVGVGGFMEFFVLQNTRLGLVMKMAERIAEGVGDWLAYRVADVAASAE